MSFQSMDVDVDWSQLPVDLLGRIATNHLSSVEDFVVFSCVCRSWYHVFNSVKAIWHPSGRLMPWLMLAEPNSDTTTRDNNTNKGWRKLFSPSRNKCYNFMLPETFGRRCWGSDHGWIVTLGLDQEMHLFNPLTNVRKSLPSQRTFPHQSDSLEDKEREREWIRSCYVEQARVFRMPQYGKHQCVVMAVHGEFCWLSYAKCGDASWMPIETTTRGMHVMEVAYCNGLFLILCQTYNLVLNFVGGDNLYGSQRPLMAVDFKLTPQNQFPCLDTVEYDMFELYGDLLLVLRHKACQHSNDLNGPWSDGPRNDEAYWRIKTEKFQVFKLDFHDKCWKELDDLGDIALFIGENGCITVEAPSAVNCRRNSIYFSDDQPQLWDERLALAGHDMGVYDMKDGSIQPIYQGDDMYSKFSCPFWFVPSLNYN